MDLLVGAPVLRREWIVGRWLDACAAAAEVAGMEPRFVLVGGIDDPTFVEVDKYPKYDVARVYVEEPRTDGRRSWAEPGRFERMVDLRNMMLGYVRDVAPTWFVSCDTDILLHPETIANCIETQAERGWAAVGGYCYLTREGTSHPNFATKPSPLVLRRTNIAGRVQQCDILMAIKVMTPDAYGVDYEYSREGEDIGWSLAVRKAGFRLGVDARAVSKHVMDPKSIDVVDQRLGW